MIYHNIDFGWISNDEPVYVILFYFILFLSPGDCENGS